MKQLRGTVFSGAGVAGQSLERLLPHIHRRTGLHSLLPNTLNIRLPNAYVGVPEFVFEATTHSHHEDVYLERCRIRGLDALIMRTSTNYHGNTVLEIMAEAWLRQEFGIADGDIETVEVQIPTG